jgi:sugar lactone lactonase YvrE
MNAEINPVNLTGASHLTMDGSGNIYFTDAGNSVVRKITPTGIISTIAGNGTAGFSGDGGQATAAKLYQPGGVAVDGSGNIYIADTDNGRVRKINTSGVISTFAGGGTYTGNGGQATAAALTSPSGDLRNRS